jgi:hypothetical protein
VGNGNLGRADPEQKAGTGIENEECTKRESSNYGPRSDDIRREPNSTQKKTIFSIEIPTTVLQPPRSPRSLPHLIGNNKLSF